jgi:hypothetical protein
MFLSGQPEVARQYPGGDLQGVAQSLFDFHFVEGSGEDAVRYLKPLSAHDKYRQGG